MDARDLAKCSALDRVVCLIEAHDTLRTAAAESKALARLRKHIRELQEIAAFQAAAAAQGPILTARRKELRAEIAELMETISVAAELGTSASQVLSVFTKPPVFEYDMKFVVHAIAFANAAKGMLDALADAGLTPGLPDEIISLAAELNQIAAEHDVLSRQLEANNRYLPTAFKSAFLAFDLVRRQLRPAVTRTLAAEWKAAAALGRTHRPNAIAAPASRRLLGSGTEREAESPSIPDETRPVEAIEPPAAQAAP